MGQRGPLGSLPALQQQGGGEAWLLQPRSALCESLSQPWRGNVLLFYCWGNGGSEQPSHLPTVKE